MYVDYVHKQNQTWPQKTDDFLPYADHPFSYWTGYFTSRPNFKVIGTRMWLEKRRQKEKRESERERERVRKQEGSREEKREVVGICVTNFEQTFGSLSGIREKDEQLASSMQAVGGPSQRFS